MVGLKNVYNDMAVFCLLSFGLWAFYRITG
jgi:hypothetical protein